MVGTVFDIKEFSVYDGPGVRVTVFLKGCPLKCLWCHNPEGLSPRPQVMVTAASCVSCGLCRIEGCPLTGGAKEFLSSKADCKGCGECVEKCPSAYRKISGRQYTPKELADAVMKNAVFLSDGGGVTFSGGEPTMQAEFLLETMALIPLHKTVQTCGQCDPKTFKRVIDASDLMFFDIKHPNSSEHKKYTGVGNETILKNLSQLKESGKPFIARIPLIKGINDSAESLAATAELLSGRSGLLRVELLPYNTVAGAKYQMTGRDFPYSFEAPDLASLDISAFERLGIECRIL